MIIHVGDVYTRMLYHNTSAFIKTQFITYGVQYRFFRDAYNFCTDAYVSELRRHVRVVYVRRYSLLANGLDLIRFSIEIPPSYVAMKTPSVLDGGY